MEKTNAEKIQELKALRAELLAYKEQQDGESGDGATDHSAVIATMRRAYSVDFDETRDSTQTISETRQQLASQYEEESVENQSQEKAHTLTLRR